MLVLPTATAVAATATVHVVSSSPAYVGTFPAQVLRERIAKLDEENRLLRAEVRRLFRLLYGPDWRLDLIS